MRTRVIALQKSSSGSNFMCKTDMLKYKVNKAGDAETRIEEHLQSVRLNILCRDIALFCTSLI